MGDGEAAAGKFGEERLDVADASPAMGGVAVVPDGPVARQTADHRAIGEIVADEADMALGVEGRAVEGDDAAAFPWPRCWSAWRPSAVSAAAS